jgi:hypothetical protein
LLLFILYAFILQTINLLAKKKNKNQNYPLFVRISHNVTIHKIIPQILYTHMKIIDVVEIHMNIVHHQKDG